VSRYERRRKRAEIHNALCASHYRSASTRPRLQPASLPLIKGILRRLDVDGTVRDSVKRPDNASPATTVSASLAIRLLAYQAHRDNNQ
jgi:hypothetical protein